MAEDPKTDRESTTAPKVKESETDQPTEGSTKQSAAKSTRSVSAQAEELPEAPPLKQEDWLQYLESNSAWTALTRNFEINYGDDTIDIPDLDFRAAQRAEHAARVILEIYGFEVSGSIEPLSLVVKES
jgi:hypothetical protein